MCPLSFFFSLSLFSFSIPCAFSVSAARAFHTTPGLSLPIVRHHLLYLCVLHVLELALKSTPPPHTLLMDLVARRRTARRAGTTPFETAGKCCPKITAFIHPRVCLHVYCNFLV
uniref:Putative secreted protein n=1 Tax=Anopheles darlingi TaxID=43151 RepID=A0A2M4DKS9_ANODA